MSTFKKLQQFGASVYAAVDTFLETCGNLVMSLPSLPRDLYHRWCPRRASLRVLLATLESMGQRAYVMQGRLYWALRDSVVVTMDIDTALHARRAAAYTAGGHEIADAQVLALRVHAATVLARATNEYIQDWLARMCIEMLQTLEESPEFVQHHAKGLRIDSMSNNTLSIVRSTRVALQCVYTPRDLSQAALVWDFLAVVDLCDDPLLIEHYAHTVREVSTRVAKQRNRAVMIVREQLKRHIGSDQALIARLAYSAGLDGEDREVSLTECYNAIVAARNPAPAATAEPAQESEDSYW